MNTKTHALKTARRDKFFFQETGSLVRVIGQKKRTENIVGVNYIIEIAGKYKEWAENMHILQRKFGK